ncbi:MAG: four helix bundle protein [Fidelibacterota bacterium]
MSKVKTHKDLDVWKKAILLVSDIYKLTQSFPSEERYGITSQMRRAAISIPSNIAEGAARNSSKEFVQFLYISLGSIAELDTQLEIAKRLGLNTKMTNLSLLEDVRKMILGLIKHQKEKK